MISARAGTCRASSGFGLPEEPRRAPKSERPAWRPRCHGDYCLMASCRVVGKADEDTCVRVVGYDRYVDVADAVERACRTLVDTDPRFGATGFECSEVRLALLRHPRKECAGQIFEVSEDGSSTRLA